MAGCQGVEGDGIQSHADAAVESLDGAIQTSDAATVTADAGPVDAGARDAGSRQVPIFLASGHMARTIISCDDGKTWVANHSDADLLRCFYPNGNPDGGDANCDHNEGSAHGLV